jgi:hypothetical protein
LLESRRLYIPDTLTRPAESFAIPWVTKAGRLVECPYIFQTSGKPHVKIGSEICAFIQDTECTSQTGYMHRW